ncbi:MAG: ATP-binding protein [Campylobacterota bacterium]|nr:ATP-binding protein [Campylobacterota bacterium]
MKENKNDVLLKEFKTYLENNDNESIVLNLPKLLKTFTKLSTRTDRILRQSDSQQLEVLKLKENIEEKNDRINTLLNNAGQGFLYFNSDMKIGEEYSKEVLNIFCEDVANKDITLLLYKDIDDASFLKATLKSILQDTSIRQEILISLLQKEFKISNKFIEIEYKVLDNENFMMILTDITSKKELAKKIKQEQQVLKMVVEIVTSLEQFLEVKKDFELFLDKFSTFKRVERLSDLRKEIHTYKGLFAQKEMLHIVEQLHSFESIVDNSIKSKKLDKKIIDITKKDIALWLDDDIGILKDILGDDFLDKSNLINIDKNRIYKIVGKIEDILKSKDKLPDINTYENLKLIKKDLFELTYYNISIFFTPYSKLVEQLAKKLEKSINPLFLDIDEIYISNKYIPFLNSLVHIFRNSVDHGIESIEQRYENNKNELATIKCSVKNENNKIIIKISDDGVGIDIKKIKALAIEKMIYTKDEIDKLSDDDILKIIFKDEFSTSKKVTTISGRGVGLASILNELNKIDGDMQINNHFQKGIEFIFSIPKD